MNIKEEIIHVHTSAEGILIHNRQWNYVEVPIIRSVLGGREINTERYNKIFDKSKLLEQLDECSIPFILTGSAVSYILDLSDIYPNDIDLYVHQTKGDYNTLFTHVLDNPLHSAAMRVGNNRGYYLRYREVGYDIYPYTNEYFSQVMNSTHPSLAKKHLIDPMHAFVVPIHLMAMAESFDEFKFWGHKQMDHISKLSKMMIKINNIKYEPEQQSSMDKYWFNGRSIAPEFTKVPY